MNLYNHLYYQNLIKSGGIRFVKNKQELAKWINIYLKNPDIDKEGRKRIVKEQCWQIDGRAGERVADFLVRHLKQ